MEKRRDTLVRLFGRSFSYMRTCLFNALSIGPVPNHLAFILDGNRRYARKRNLGEGMGHRAGFLSLMSLMKYCYELGVKYVTVYAFSIDNFKRRPDEVNHVMDLMLEKIEGLLKEESIVNQYGVRVYFIGNLKLLNERVREAAEKAMKATSNNNRCVLLICVAYSSTDEISHAAQESCEEKIQSLMCATVYKDKSDAPNGEEKILSLMCTTVSKDKNDAPKAVSKDKNDALDGEEKIQSLMSTSLSKDRNDAPNGEERQQHDDGNGVVIKLSDVEKHMYMGVAPDPDVLVRTSGETRLSNFLLWQTSNSLLQSPKALWPEYGLSHLVWAILDFQRNHPYLERRRK